MTTFKKLFVPDPPIIITLLVVIITFLRAVIGLDSVAQRKGKSIKKIILLLGFTIIALGHIAIAQTKGSFIVQGSLSNYYPVSITDPEWSQNVATEVELGRSSVHIDESWRGSLIAKFRYHTYQWGNASGFIDADIVQSQHDGTALPFVAGWKDVTYSNMDGKILVWLKGGSTTYFYQSASPVSFTVYDGVQNSLPFIETNGSSYSYKTMIDSYVNSFGYSTSKNIYVTGSGNNFLSGNVGIGTTSPTEKLSVNGNIRSKKLIVTQTNWSDYVFDSSYQLKPFREVEQFIKTNKHLPDIPSAKDVEKEGLDVGENQAILLKKIEELTLYIIEQGKQIKEQEKNFSALQLKLETQINQLRISVKKLMSHE